MADAAADLKQQGNEEFVKGNYKEAIDLYNQAIKSDPTNHLLFGNRAAAFFKQGSFEAAAADASQSITLHPSWSKGHVRLAQALDKLGKWKEASAAADAALALEPENAFVTDLATRIARAYFHSCIKLPLETPADFLRAFRVCRDVRMRLATLASFWNLCSQDERHAVFSALLPAVQASGLAQAVTAAQGEEGGGAPPSDSSQPLETAASGGPAPAAQLSAQDVALQSLRPQDVPHGAMVELPMRNYEDVALPSEWLHWFKQLGATQRPSVFQDAWDACYAEERLLVAGDMLHFLRQSLGGGASGLAGSGAGMTPAGHSSADGATQ